ncbi:MFS transporter [Streptomyces evansiae]|uniref:MFS transporter n=1 Tax=Streptomyces evansiae TaxID=3075535 RepID=UPI002888078F|nr:MFS transporter [Streptomyces sp. DSM 41859]MDT0419921.1 MFS transporter [Streptomyces sp. DSM 41859]
MNTAPRSLRPLIGVLLALGVAQTATRISAIALPWYVLATTGSATQTGLVAFCEMGPYVLAQTFGGPLVDRVGARVVSGTTDLVSALAAAAIPLLDVSGALNIGVLLALVAVIGTARGPGDLAKHVMVPEAADLARVPMERATGLSGTVERLASTLGLAGGGAVVALLGALTSLTVMAGLFALGSLVVLTTLPRRATAPTHHATETETETEEDEGYWRRLRAGAAFLRRDRLLLAVCVVVGVTNLLDAATSSVLIPVWARDSGGGVGSIGLVGAAMGIGGVAGSVVAAMYAHRLRRRPVFFFGYLMAGAPRYAVLALDVPLWLVLTVFVASGLGAGFLNPILGAVQIERVPRPLLGRVSGLVTAFAWAGIPFGGLVAGSLLGATALVPALLVFGALYFLTTSLAGLLPEWREMDRRRGAAVTGAVPRTGDHESSPSGV